MGKMQVETATNKTNEELGNWRPNDSHGAELKRALEFHKEGKLFKAKEIYQSILDREPQHPDALHLLGMLVAQQGEYEDAIKFVRKAIAQFPNSEVLYNNLGNILYKAGRLEEAKDAYQKSKKLHPDSFVAYNNLGINFRRLGKPLESIKFFKKALEIRPDSAEVYSDLGNVFSELNQFSSAIDCYEKAIKIKPGFAKAYNNMGSVLVHQDRYAEAIDYYCKAVENDLNYAEAFNNIGAAITDMGKPEEAIKFFQKALELKPESEIFLTNLYDTKRRTCDWQELDVLDNKLDAHACRSLETGTRSVEPPFLNLLRHDDLSFNYSIARSWSLDISRRMSAIKTDFDFRDRKKDQKTITLGYFSSNFRDHAMAHLMAGLFERHDRHRYRVFAYSNGENDGSDFRKRIEKGCDKFVDIRHQDHLKAAQTIYRDKVDILIDLMGYTKGGRMEIAALRPAPVQVRYMGMAGTTGSDFFDYLIADQTVVPVDHQGYYSEQLVYLPDCYQINDDQQKIANVQFNRKTLGLPEADVVFCSFNQPGKLDPVIFSAWMDILRAVPQSVLWLLAGSKAGEQNLLKEAEKLGIEARRLVFAGKLSKPEHLARLQLADLALDTRMVSGAATTSDALWAGVPVVTLQGRHFSSRMSASILKAAGLSTLITSDLHEYVNLSVALAKEKERLERIKSFIHTKVRKSSPFNSDDTAKQLDQSYEIMWRHSFHSK
jgi:predicted O-linked N-acetylglucosamine transferase (SPINDLY family)